MTSTALSNIALLLQSNLDEHDLGQVNALASQCKDAADRGDWVLSTQLWAATELLIWNLTNFVDFYNVLKYVNVDFQELERQMLLTSDGYEEAKKAFLMKTLRTYIKRHVTSITSIIVLFLRLGKSQTWWQ